MKNAFSELKEVLPAFPSTPHLPHKPNTDKTDRVASEDYASVVFSKPICIEDKVDGASCGMTLYEGEAVIRNRDHILRKGYVKDTAAKKQFASVWNWFYDHKKCFEHLSGIGPYSVYGEWCLAQHGIAYTRLPAWFIAYDIYDYERHLWIPSLRARTLLEAAGFVVPTLRFWGSFEGTYEDLEVLANLPSPWADDKAEGIYIKVSDDTQITHRFKMVREGFVRGALWNPEKYTKNQIVKGE